MRFEYYSTLFKIYLVMIDVIDCIPIPIIAINYLYKKKYIKECNTTCNNNNYKFITKAITHNNL